MRKLNGLRKFSTYSTVHRLLVELIDQKATLSDEELNAVKLQLKSNSRDPLNHLLWSIASYGPPMRDLIKQAQRLLAPYKILSDEGIYSLALPEAMRYLLKSSKATPTLSAELSTAGPPLLRRAFAEFLIEEGRISEGLWLMLDILETVGTDHATADNILLNFIANGTADIKMALLIEAKNCDTRGNSTRAENARWLASSISIDAH